jgi:hypothetical protein
METTYALRCTHDISSILVAESTLASVLPPLALANLPVAVLRRRILSTYTPRPQPPYLNT